VISGTSFLQASGMKLSIPLAKYRTVFQAEVYAIWASVSSINTEEESSIAICLGN